MIQYSDFDIVIYHLQFSEKPYKESLRKHKCAGLSLSIRGSANGKLALETHCSLMNM